MKILKSAYRGSPVKLERKVLYVGPAGPQIDQGLDPENSGFRLEIAESVADAFRIMRVKRCETVIVDQRNYRAELDLLIARVAGFKNPSRLIVLTGASSNADYSRVLGIHALLAGDVSIETLRIAVGLNPGQIETNQSSTLLGKVLEPLKPLREWQGSSRRLMSTVSNLYKYSAFFLLASLFAAFVFYGIMIGFFLISSGWAAPQTLSKGHELVAKVEQQVSDMRVNLNLVSQRHSEAELEADQAERSHRDAKLLMAYVGSTIDSEILQRKARWQAIEQQLKRLDGLKETFDHAIRSSGMDKDLASIFEKRIITRRTFNSNVLGLLESGQRLAVMEAEQATARLDATEIEKSISMLTSLKQQLDSGKASQISGASADLVLLAKQAIDATSAFEQAQTQLDSAKRRQTLLANSKSILEDRIGDVLKTPLGRATKARVDVLFIPYGNENNFKPGEPLYVCALTIVFCHEVGKAGAFIPGESNTVHPFFGKPLRGVFAEAILDDPEAASAEVIHAGRPPFFF